MATMLSGAAIIDAALLMISANEPCPQPQTVEHLMALEIIGIKNIIVVQNKIDLVDEKRAKENYKEIKALLKPSIYKNVPIIPISAQHNVNIDLLLQTINEQFKVPKRDPKVDPIMLVARSFDINKPGSPLKSLVGGVLGGSVSKGVIKKGDLIEISPGYMVEEKNQQVWKTLTTKVTGIMSGNEKIDSAGPGGSIALMTELDPSIVKSDTLAGSLVGKPEKLPALRQELKLKIKLLQRVVGAKDKLVVEPIKMSEPLMINVNSSTSVGIISKMKKDNVVMALKLPICAEVGARVALSRQIGQRWRLIGFGLIEE
jgi:translation initiation factor 2 subunit 3